MRHVNSINHPRVLGILVLPTILFPANTKRKRYGYVRLENRRYI